MDARAGLVDLGRMRVSLTPMERMTLRGEIRYSVSTGKFSVDRRRDPIVCTIP